MAEVKIGKVVSILSFWVVESHMDTETYSVSKFQTRKQARERMKNNKNSGWFDKVQMFKATDVVFCNGDSFLTKKKVR